MILIRGPIPLVIHPFFWLFSALIGWIMGQSVVGMLVWVGIIFVSVVVHEYGHALTAVCFKQKASIQLVAMGGLTSYEGPKLAFWKQFLITLNGPVFGFLLFLLATLLLKMPLTPFLFKVLKMTQIANLFWTVVNLLPVLPLDGGQLMRIALEAIFGVRGFKFSLFVGALIAVGFSLYFFLIQAYLIGAFFFLFAFQSFDSWRRARLATVEDRDDANRKLMMEAERALQENRLQDAKAFLEQVREKTKNGILAQTAEQYLAFLAYKEGRKKEAYELLLPMKERLSDDFLCLLHELAAEEKNYDVVMDLSTKCYQLQQDQKTALNNARAFAYGKKAKYAGGWLQTAWQFGGLHLKQLLDEEVFQEVKENPEFQEFLVGLK